MSVPINTSVRVDNPSHELDGVAARVINTDRDFDGEPLGDNEVEIIYDPLSTGGGFRRERIDEAYLQVIC